MYTPSYKGIIQKGLIYHTDLAQASCWVITPPIPSIPSGYNTDGSIHYSSAIPSTYSPIINPLTTVNEINVSVVPLDDYGLTEIDMGRVKTLQDGFTGKTQAGLVLNASNIPLDITNGAISGATTQKTGNYLLLSGQYFQNFFKLDGYEYELLPSRYADGVTLETSLLITKDTFLSDDNFFIFLGTRAENKFYDDFNAPYVISGPASGSTSGSTITWKTPTTSSGLPLGPDHADKPELGVEGNAIGFLFDKQGRIGYRTVTDDLKIIESFSENHITHTGWVAISLAYTPCDKITDPDLLECTPRRGGTLRVFVNGIIFHEFHDFQEYMFHRMNTEKEKQIGVPYTLSWGGGTNGLGISSFFGSGGTINQVNQSGLLLRQHFNGRFLGGAQTLRIYNRPLSALEARENHNVLAPRYGLPLVIGGRVTPKINW